MADQHQDAVDRLLEIVKSIGSSRDTFADRIQLGDFVLFETPGLPTDSVATTVEVVHHRPTAGTSPVLVETLKG
jgi:hypothetical protein